MQTEMRPDGNSFAQDKAHNVPWAIIIARLLNPYRRACFCALSDLSGTVMIYCKPFALYNGAGPDE